VGVEAAVVVVVVVVVVVETGQEGQGSQTQVSLEQVGQQDALSSLSTVLVGLEKMSFRPPSPTNPTTAGKPCASG
jgi:hypothetical protein